jgi:hypothetical protein
VIVTRTFNTPLDGALYAIGRGLPVVPLHGGKFPTMEDWPNKATTDKDQVLAWDAASPGVNWGVHCDNMVVVDVDVKDGKAGLDNWQRLLRENGGIGSTLIVKTPSGGYHFYFTGPSIAKNSVGKLGQGLDTRTRGGQVVFAGSRTEQGEYIIEREADIAPAPGWLITKVQEAKHDAQDDAIFTGDKLIEGVRQDSLKQAAFRLQGMGLDPTDLHEIISRINKKYLADPLPQADIDGLAARISKYPPRDAILAARFGEHRIDVADAQSWGDLCALDLPKRRFILEHRLAPGFIAEVDSPGGSGKSTYSLLVALSVLTGRPLAGAKVLEQGPVWLLNTEDPLDEMRRRVKAMLQHHKIPDTEVKDLHLTSGRDRPFVFVKNLTGTAQMNRADIDRAVDIILKNKIKLWVVDPFVRCHRADENSNMDMDLVMLALNEVMEKTGCAILLVHHTQKMIGKQGRGVLGGRGASAVANAARFAHTLYSMVEDETREYQGVAPGDEHWYIRLDQSKSNMSPPGTKPTWFRRVSVTLPNGDEVGALEHAEILPLSDLPRDYDDVQKETVLLIARLLARHGTLSGARLQAEVKADPMCPPEMQKLSAQAWAAHMRRLSERTELLQESAIEWFCTGKEKGFKLT